VAPRPHEVERLGPVLFAAAKLADERRRALASRGNELRLRERLDRVTQVDPATGLQPMEFFQRALELELKRARRYGYALSVCMVRLTAVGAASAELRAQAMTALAATVRDIDLPVEIGGDRVLILLPYTDAVGAASVARRAVAAIATVGRSGARMSALAGVAGGIGGAELSLAALMRSAAAALREAERGDGAVVVAP
jgi:PleD family two-component response regulator